MRLRADLLLGDGDRDQVVDRDLSRVKSGRRRFVVSEVTANDQLTGSAPIRRTKTGGENLGNVSPASPAGNRPDLMKLRAVPVEPIDLP